MIPCNDVIEFYILVKIPNISPPILIIIIFGFKPKVNIKVVIFFFLNIKQVKKGAGTMFGQRLRELRNKKNISATALGKVLGIAQTTISNWENSGYEPNYEMLVKISHYFGVSVDYLVGNDNDVNKNEISRLAKELYEDLDDLPEDERHDIEKGLLEYLEFLGYKLKKTKK